MCKDSIEGAKCEQLQQLHDNDEQSGTVVKGVFNVVLNGMNVVMQLEMVVMERLNGQSNVPLVPGIYPPMCLTNCRTSN